MPLACLDGNRDSSQRREFSDSLYRSQNLNIAGPGAALLAISGNHASQVFFISGGTVSIDGLTLLSSSVLWESRL